MKALIVCDEPGCNWSEEGAVENYHNKPCPECGKGILISDIDMEVYEHLVEAEAVSRILAKCKMLGKEVADLRARTEELEGENGRLMRESDKYEDGIDWIQRALQAEARLEAAEGRVKQLESEIEYLHEQEAGESI